MSLFKPGKKYSVRVLLQANSNPGPSKHLFERRSNTKRLTIRIPLCADGQKIILQKDVQNVVKTVNFNLHTFKHIRASLTV